MTRWSALLALLAAVLLAPAGSADDAARRTTARVIGPGVEHSTWALAGSSTGVHLAEVDPDGGARLEVAQAAGGTLSGREPTSAICRRTAGCGLAVNGDFFGADGAVGGVVADARVLRSPRSDHEQVALAPLGVVPSTDWTAVAASGTRRLGLTAVNRPPGPDDAVLWTPDAGPATPACDCTELVLRALDGRPGDLSGSALTAITARAAGGTALLPGTAVLAARGAAVGRLQALLPGPVRVTVSAPVPLRESLGAHPVLLRGGRPAPVDEVDPMLRDPEPRTALGWDGTGRVWLAVFDGRRTGGPGPTAAQAARFLLDRGATDAVLLDGGGSATMATPTGPLNAPSDGAERAVSNAVVVTWPRDPAVLRARAAARRQPARVAAPAVAAPVPAVARSVAPTAAPAARRPAAPTRGTAAPAPAALPVRTAPDVVALRALFPGPVALPAPVRAPLPPGLLLLAAGLLAAAAAAVSGTAWTQAVARLLTPAGGPAPR